MKLRHVLTILVAVFFSARGEAAAPAGFDLEVQICADGTFSLSEFEGDRLQQHPEAIDTRALSELSPARASAYENFIQTYWTRLIVRKGATLRPRYPSTALMHKDGCHPEVVASVTSSSTTIFSGELNGDLWSSLSTKTQQLFLSEAYLNFERMIWAASEINSPWQPVIWNPTLSREFLYRWTRTRTLRSFFELARTIELPFVEQSGFILPLHPYSHTVWNPQTGLVIETHKSPITLSALWLANVKIAGLTLTNYTWHSSDYSEGLRFHDDGSFHCGPLQSADTKTMLPLSHPIFGASHWGSHSYLQWSLCVSKAGQIEQGYLWVPWSQPKTWQLGDQTMIIDQDPLAGGTNQGTWISFYPDQSVKLIMTSRGVQRVQGRDIEVHGPLLLGEKDSQTGTQRLLCSGLPLGTRWTLSDGSSITVKDRTDYFCSQVPPTLQGELRKAIGSAPRNVYELR